MKKTLFFLIAICAFAQLTACSTINMERKLAEEQRIDSSLYAYDDDQFQYNDQLVQTLAERFRFDALSTTNVNSIMRDEIAAGNFNEVIIYLRYLATEKETQAAMYTERYYEALQAHVRNTNEPSPKLVEDTITQAKRQYEMEPDKQNNVAYYASLLIDTKYDIEQGIQLLLDLEEKLYARSEDPNKQTLHALANAYYLNGNYEESVENYLFLIAIEPDDMSLYYTLSYVLEEMGEHEAAAAYLEMTYSPTTDFLKTYGTDTFGMYRSYFEAKSK
ncbi:tetratricopeptide repeat protein [Alkalihalobacillus sp. MEB130]|uniref:tetratricopeptide repeat protein n=1 Tax=Alkalihalobacillus sp. MEB130 TaxID=2976704 RepID=UPI0028DE6750|nr:tetratricopeptide repeat protein [Alkalihalobacillus sp. MEB130]MDT8858820.1 tetratricopeptide repeat protein [Alkalihalobacillus sp. MEB130]